MFVFFNIDILTGIIFQKTTASQNNFGAKQFPKQTGLGISLVEIFEIRRYSDSESSVRGLYSDIMISIFSHN